MKKVPPTPGGSSTRIFTKKEHSGFGNVLSLYIGEIAILCGTCKIQTIARSETNRPLTTRLTGNHPEAAAQGKRPLLPWSTTSAIMMTAATINYSSDLHGRFHYGSYSPLWHQPWLMYIRICSVNSSSYLWTLPSSSSPT